MQCVVHEGLDSPSSGSGSIVAHWSAGLAGDTPGGAQVQPHSLHGKYNAKLESTR